MLGREASTCTIAPDACRVPGARCPECVLSCRSLKTVLSEVNFYSVFWGKQRGWSKGKFSCHTCF